MILNEVYFGKTPEVQKIEKVIESYKSKYDQKDLYSEKLIHDPLKYDLGKALEDAFGFEIAEVSIVPTSTLNAFTFPIGYKLDTIPSKNLIVTAKTGMKYKKEAGYVVTVYIHSGLLLHNEFTAGEITAVILHEIGHNFTPAVMTSQSIFGKMRMISQIALAFYQMGPAAIGSALSITNFMDKFGIKFRKFIDQKFPTFSMLITSLNAFFASLKDVGQFLGELIGAFNPISNAIQYGIQSIIGILIDPLGIIVGNTDENFADSFAAMYGYGEELSEALSKLDDNATLFRQSIKNSTIFNNLYSISLLPVHMLVGIFDEHSNSCVRSAKLLEMLDNEVKNGDYSPKFKKRIHQDIKKVEASIDKAYNTISEDEDPKATQKLWAQFLLNSKCYKIYDFILNRATPENVDSSIKDKMNEFDKIKFK